MEISNYKRENIIGYINHGSEGTVYLYNDNGREVALKIFHIDDKSLNNDNKEEKLMILKHEEYLQDDITLLNRMYFNGKFIGYTSRYEPYRPLSFLIPKKQKIEFLTRLKEKFEALNSHGIYIGDFNQANIALIDNKLKLYDVDNFRVGNLDFNIHDIIMESYISRSKDPKEIDYYCYNYFGLGLMASTEPDSIYLGIGRKNLPRELKISEAKEFIRNLDYHILEKDKDGKPKTLLNYLK